MDIRHRAAGQALVLAVALLAARPAPARLWSAYDMNSLAFLAQDVVLAREVGVRELDRNFTLRTFEVEKVFKGSLKPKDRVEVRDTYPRKGSGQFGHITPEKFDLQVFLFLKPWSQRSVWPKEFKAEDKPMVEIVHSGLRLLADGKVYEFRQFSNPGGIHPVPAEKGPFLGWLTLQPMTLDEFEALLKGAVSVAERYEALREGKDQKARREGILALLECYKEEAEYRRKTGRENLGIMLSSSPFLGKVIEEFVADGDMEGALGAIDITARFDAFEIEARKLLKAAGRKELPMRLRTTAIEAIPWRCFDEVETIRGLAKLVEGDAEVEEAAAKKLRRLHRGYTGNKHMNTPELAKAWEEALKVLEGSEAPAPGKKGS
jgi:hypothetical protein